MAKFTKGRSGNPGGRRKTPPDVRDALIAACPRAVARLIELLDSDDERIALRASEVVIERCLGKVPQPLIGADGDDSPIEIKIIPVRFAEPETITRPDVDG